MSSTDSGYQWGSSEGNVQSVEMYNLKLIYGVFRNPKMITINLESVYYRSSESGFIDLLNVHNVYLHCPDLGQFNSKGVRGEDTIIKQIPVSSSFGYLIIDSVVAPHDKYDAGRQLINNSSI